MAKARNLGKEKVEGDSDSDFESETETEEDASSSSVSDEEDDPEVDFDDVSLQKITQMLMRYFVEEKRGDIMLNSCKAAAAFVAKVCGKSIHEVYYGHSVFAEIEDRWDGSLPVDGHPLFRSKDAKRKDKLKDQQGKKNKNRGYFVRMEKEISTKVQEFFEQECKAFIKKQKGLGIVLQDKSWQNPWKKLKTRLTIFRKGHLYVKLASKKGTKWTEVTRKVKAYLKKCTTDAAAERELVSLVKSIHKKAYPDYWTAIAKEKQRKKGAAKEDEDDEKEEEENEGDNPTDKGDKVVPGNKTSLPTVAAATPMPTTPPTTLNATGATPAAAPEPAPVTVSPAADAAGEKIELVYPGRDKYPTNETLNGPPTRRHEFRNFNPDWVTSNRTLLQSIGSIVDSLCLLDEFNSNHSGFHAGRVAYIRAILVPEKKLSINGAWRDDPYASHPKKEGELVKFRNPFLPPTAQGYAKEMLPTTIVGFTMGVLFITMGCIVSHEMEEHINTLRRFRALGVLHHKKMASMDKEKFNLLQEVLVLSGHSNDEAWTLAETLENFAKEVFKQGLRVSFEALSGFPGMNESFARVILQECYGWNRIPISYYSKRFLLVSGLVAYEEKFFKKDCKDGGTDFLDMEIEKIDDFDLEQSLMLWLPTSLYPVFDKITTLGCLLDMPRVSYEQRSQIRVKILQTIRGLGMPKGTAISTHLAHLMDLLDFEKGIDWRSPLGDRETRKTALSRHQRLRKTPPNPANVSEPPPSPLSTDDPAPSPPTPTPPKPANVSEPPPSSLSTDDPASLPQEKEAPPRPPTPMPPKPANVSEPPPSPLGTDDPASLPQESEVPPSPPKKADPNELKENAEPHVEDVLQELWTAKYELDGEKHEDVIAQLYDIVTPKNVNCQDKEQRTVLMAYAATKSLSNLSEVMENCIAKGADGRLRDKDGKTALHWAVLTLNLPAIVVLCRLLPGMKDLKDNDNLTPREFAETLYPNEQVIQCLDTCNPDYDWWSDSGDGGCLDSKSNVDTESDEDLQKDDDDDESSDSKSILGAGEPDEDSNEDDDDDGSSDFGSSEYPDAVSDYEKRRDENIKRNQERLKTLGLENPILGGEKKKALQSRRRKSEGNSAPTEPTRRSSRQSSTSPPAKSKAKQTNLKKRARSNDEGGQNKKVKKNATPKLEEPIPVMATAELYLLPSVKKVMDSDEIEKFGMLKGEIVTKARKTKPNQRKGRFTMRWSSSLPLGVSEDMLNLSIEATKTNQHLMTAAMARF